MLEDRTLDRPVASAAATRKTSAPRTTCVLIPTPRAHATGASTADPGSMLALLPIMGAIFVAFLVTGMAMPVLPLHVHEGLGLSTVVVGCVAASQFVAALMSRPLAGWHADTRGAKHAVVVGLVLASSAGVLYFVSLQVVSQPTTSVAILLVGRALLGIGESFVITGAQTWGLLLGGPKNTGKVLAWA